MAWEGSKLLVRRERVSILEKRVGIPEAGNGPGHGLVTVETE